MIEQPAQQLDQHDLEQTIRQQPRSAPHALRLREQQIEPGSQPVDIPERDADERRQGPDQRIAIAAVEIESRTSIDPLRRTCRKAWPGTVSKVVVPQRPPE